MRTEPVECIRNSSVIGADGAVIMNTGRVMEGKSIVFRPSMSGFELADSIQSLDGGLNTYVHDVTIENGEFVVYLRKPTTSEKLKMALMPKSMERERVAVAHSVIREAANKIGVDGTQVVRAIGSGRGAAVHQIRDEAIRVALHNRGHEDLV